MKRFIDLAAWNRCEHFELFRKYDVPFRSVSANVDVTQSFRWCKEHGHSFATAYHWAVTKAVNAIDALRKRIENDVPVLFDTIHMSTTIDRFAMLEHAHSLGDSATIPFPTFGESFEENGKRHFVSITPWSTVSTSDGFMNGWRKF
jgi:chloramphenicol O-acetyltransferase